MQIARARASDPYSERQLALQSLRVLAPAREPPPGYTVTRADGSQSHHESPTQGSGYGYQILEVMRCLREGRTESEIMPLDETLAIMQTMDEARRQFGLRYAADS